MKIFKQKHEAINLNIINSPEQKVGNFLHKTEKYPQL